MQYTERDLIHLVGKHMYWDTKVTSLPDIAARIYAAVVAGDRTLKLPGVDANNGMMKVLNKVLNRFRAPNTFQKVRAATNCPTARSHLLIQSLTSDCCFITTRAGQDLPITIQRVRSVSCQDVPRP